jgi:hypothetical protein
MLVPKHARREIAARVKGSYERLEGGGGWIGATQYF